MKVLLFVIFSLFSGLIIAEDKIETRQLHHRLAVEVLPEIQAFLPKTATARAFNNIIILQASPHVIKEVKQLIDQLDTPLQRLKISVLKTDENLSTQQAIQVGADIKVTNEHASAGVAVNAWSTNSARNKDQQYQAQGLAGHPILIAMGQDIPQNTQDIIFLPQGAVAVQSSTNYISLNNGFQAIARILPNHQVVVDIHPRFSQHSKRTGTIETSDIISTISGPVGKWIELGHIDNENKFEKQGARSYRSHRQLQQTIYIKVDPL